MLKDMRFFLSKEVNSAIILTVPRGKYLREGYEIVMRDCSRQIDWEFSPDKKGLAKIKKVCNLFNAVRDELEEKVNNQ